jgi:hypothetical protein
MVVAPFATGGRRGYFKYVASQSASALFQRSLSSGF